MEKLFSKLDLDEYIKSFNSFLARQKPLFLEGDNKINYEKILELSKLDLKAPEEVKNLDDALMRLSKHAVLHIKDIYEFIKIIKYFDYLKHQNFEGKMAEYLSKIIFPEEIDSFIDYFDEKGDFKDSADERLLAITQAYKIKKAQIGESLRSLLNSKALSPYIVDTQIHYVNENESLLVRGGFNQALKGTVVARSDGGYFYVLPACIDKLKSEQAALLDKREEIIYEHCKKISLTFNKILPFLKFINNAFDSVDGLLARVFLAKNKDLNFVLRDSSNDIILKEFAHPALSDPKRVSVDFSKKVLLITGVNAGGKSMLLKSILSAALLAKYLLPMPVNPNGTKIGTFKEFNAIIDDPQSVKNDISTFAGRISQFSKLFGKKSLLIGIDEIELGTDSQEAAALYGEIITSLLKNDIKMVITTHHKHLAMLISKHDGVELLAALYDEKMAKPKYEFLPGIIGKSYAFETALRYGIPANLVGAAKKTHGENKENFEQIITKAINLESELKLKIEDSEKKSKKLDGLISNLKEQKINADSKLRSEISRLDREYYEAISEAKRGINLKDTKDKQRSLNKANTLLNKVKKPSFKESIEELKVGDRVKYGNVKGKIVSIKNKDVLIDADGISLRVPLNSLKKGGAEVKQAIKASINMQHPINGGLVLDLHGLRADEAISRLDKFISDSLLVGHDEVIVKHGIGTGRLAFLVKDFLTKHPSVKSFEDGSPREGGFGSKIVKL